jgi:hypothetical protein
MSEAEQGPTEEQIRAFEEQLKHIRVEDVVVQTLVTLVNLGARRLGLTGEPDTRDLGQAQLAIEGARALMPLVPGDELGPIRDALAQLQVAFAREAQGTPEPSEGDQPPAEPQTGQQPPQQPPPQQQQPQQPPPPKIWTPRGS